jgi:hypothetical protein
MTPLTAIERLVGLQAQTTHTWYLGLWTRLVDFDPDQVSQLLWNRDIVRIALMRSTIHLVSAADCLELRPLTQGVIARVTNGAFGRALAGVDDGELADAARKVVDEEPVTFSELGRRLLTNWPDRDPAALAQGARSLLPMVQVPPRGVWGRSGQAMHTTAQQWLGRDLSAEPSIDQLVLRYLAAFGPASVMDVQAWSGLTKLAEVVNRRRASLVTFTDEEGRELFDLPDAPRPDPETPAPVRFLYDFDNLLLGHADRTRVLDVDFADHGYTAKTNLAPRAVLIDGFVGATWTVTRERETATLSVRPFEAQPDAVMESLEVEGRALLAFNEPTASHHVVQFLAP